MQSPVSSAQGVPAESGITVVRMNVDSRNSVEFPTAVNYEMAIGLAHSAVWGGPSIAHTKHRFSGYCCQQNVAGMVLQVLTFSQFRDIPMEEQFQMMQPL